MKKYLNTKLNPGLNYCLKGAFALSVCTIGTMGLASTSSSALAQTDSHHTIQWACQAECVVINTYSQTVEKLGARVTGASSYSDLNAYDDMTAQCVRRHRRNGERYGDQVYLARRVSLDTRSVNVRGEPRFVHGFYPTSDGLSFRFKFARINEGHGWCRYYNEDDFMFEVEPAEFNDTTCKRVNVNPRGTPTYTGTDPEEPRG